MIKRRKRLTEPETAFFMTQLLEATKYMHDQLVIHRDLKLGNLFLDRNMNIKVGDLGLATKLESADEIRKTICGTPNYIAPEVIQGDRAKRGHSFEVDIWSMGVIMYTCLVGKPPYEARDVKATYQRIMANEYSFPRSVNLSDDAKDLIIRMLQSKPKERPTLQEISFHPFLTAHFIPESLPSTATHTAPQWSASSSNHKAYDRPLIPKQNSSRRPFGARDPNANTAGSQRADKKKAPQAAPNPPTMMDVQGAVKSAWTAVVNATSPTRAPQVPPQPGRFQVFDETNDRNSQREQISDRDIVSRTANLGIRSSDDASSSGVRPLSRDHVSGSHNTDAFILGNMLERVSIVLDIVCSRDYSNIPSASQSLVSIPFGGPTKWVERYVDYTSKYGLGYLLNEGR